MSTSSGPARVHRNAPARKRQVAQAPALTPRPRLFAALMIVFALWVAGLLTMYFTTVFAHRHPPQPPAALTE